MIVCSGAAHAIVNAVLKAGKDKMSSRAPIDGSSALLMFPAAFFLPLPHGAWGWLAAYGLALWAYRLGDTPRLAALRETSIVFATLIAIFVLKERVTAARGAGIAVIALGAALLLMLN